MREQGRRIDCRAFTVWWRCRPGDPVAPQKSGTPRVCVIASSAAVGAAVKRNRAKRRLREVFRHHQRCVPADCDLLLIARTSINQRSMPELEKTFIDACRQIASAAPRS